MKRRLTNDSWLIRGSLERRETEVTGSGAGKRTSESQEVAIGRGCEKRPVATNTPDRAPVRPSTSGMRLWMLYRSLKLLAAEVDDPALTPHQHASPTIVERVLARHLQGEMCCLLFSQSLSGVHSSIIALSASHPTIALNDKRSAKRSRQPSALAPHSAYSAQCAVRWGR